jgi:hypothetical protein
MISKLTPPKSLRELGTILNKLLPQTSFEVLELTHSSTDKQQLTSTFDNLKRKSKTVSVVLIGH